MEPHEITDKIIKWFKSSPAIAKIEREENAERLEIRLRNIAALADIREISHKNVLAVEQRCRDVTDEHVVIKKQMKIVDDKLRAVEHELLCVRLDRRVALDKAEGILQETAPAEIIDFERWLLRESDKLRAAIIFGAEYQSDSIGRVGVFRSNSESVERKRNLITAALKRAAAMRFELGETIDEEIADLKAQIQHVTLVASKVTVRNPNLWENPTPPPRPDFSNERVLRRAGYR